MNTYTTLDLFWVGALHCISYWILFFSFLLMFVVSLPSSSSPTSVSITTTAATNISSTSTVTMTTATTQNNNSHHVSIFNITFSFSVYLFMVFHYYNNLRLWVQLFSLFLQLFTSLSYYHKKIDSSLLQTWPLQNTFFRTSSLLTHIHLMLFLFLFVCLFVLGSFYPLGDGGTVSPPQPDGTSSLIFLEGTFKYFGLTYSQIYVGYYCKHTHTHRERESVWCVLCFLCVSIFCFTYLL